MALAALLLLTACAPAADVGQTVDASTNTDEPASDIGDDEVWVLMQSHLHTTGQHDCATNPTDPGPLPDGACYTAAGIHAFLDAALAHGATDMIITDHNNIDAWFDPAFAPKASSDGSRYATPLRGSEWSSGEGHMTLFFPREVVSSNQQALDEGLLWAAGNHSDDPTPQQYRQAIANVQTHGGLVVINHPQLMIHPFDDTTYGADGVEVGVKLTPLQSTSSTRMWWHKRLLEGDRITAMAGSDHHHGGGDLPLLDAPVFGVAVNLIRVDLALPNFESAAEALANPALTIDQRSDISADAIRRGHVMVVEDTHTPRVYIGADLDGDGRFHDLRAGDCLPPGYDSDELTIRVRVTQADGEDISGHYNMVFYAGASAHKKWFHTEVDPDHGFAGDDRYWIDTTDAFAIELTVPIDHDEPGFFRVELERDVLGPFNDQKTITNPIYYGAWGDECAGSKRL